MVVTLHVFSLHARYEEQFGGVPKMQNGPNFTELNNIPATKLLASFLLDFTQQKKDTIFCAYFAYI